MSELSNYPYGVTGNESQITGIDNPDNVVDFCQEQIDKAEDIINSVLDYCDDQGLSVSPGRIASILEAFQEIRDEINSMNPPDYDWRDSRI